MVGLSDARRAAPAAVPYRQRLGLREWFWLIPVLILAAFVGFGVHRVGEPWLIPHFFGWLPAWFVFPIPLSGTHDYSASSWIVTLCAFFVLNGAIGPVVEEPYFRGYLLPRMERLGRWAPLVNASFSIYHFGPHGSSCADFGWAMVTPCAGSGTSISDGVHCSLNTFAVVLTASSVLSPIS